MDKYGSYIYKNPFKEHWEVLNNNILVAITEANSVRVIQRRDLCEKLLSANPVRHCLGATESAVAFAHGICSWGRKD